MTRKDRTEGIYNRREVLDESERLFIQFKELCRNTVFKSLLPNVLVKSHFS